MVALYLDQAFRKTSLKSVHAETLRLFYVTIMIYFIYDAKSCYQLITITQRHARHDHQFYLALSFSAPPREAVLEVHVRKAFDTGIYDLSCNRSTSFSLDLSAQMFLSAVNLLNNL
jgi:hypothetical protein